MYMVWSIMSHVYVSACFFVNVPLLLFTAGCLCEEIRAFQIECKECRGETLHLEFYNRENNNTRTSGWAIARSGSDTVEAF